MALDLWAIAAEVAPAVDISSDLAPRFRAVRSRLTPGMESACRRRPDRLARQRRHVVGGGRAAGGADRVRRQPGHRVAGLHHGHARLRFRRCADRQDHRPLRHRHRDRARHRHFGARLYWRRHVVVDLAIHPCAFRHRAVFVGHVRSADGGSLALVQPLPRARGRDRRQRQLHRRHDLAAAGEFRHAVDRLAHHPYRGRPLHRGGDGGWRWWGCGC